MTSRRLRAALTGALLAATAPGWAATPPPVPLDTPGATGTDLMATHELAHKSSGYPFLHGGFDLRGVPIDPTVDAIGVIGTLSLVRSTGAGLLPISACGGAVCPDCTLIVRRPPIPGFSGHVEDRYGHVHVDATLVDPCTSVTCAAGACGSEVVTGQPLGYIRRWGGDADPSCDVNSHLDYQVRVLADAGWVLHVAPVDRISPFTDDVPPAILSAQICDDDEVDVLTNSNPWTCRPVPFPRDPARGVLAAGICVPVSGLEHLDLLARIVDVSKTEHVTNSYPPAPGSPGSNTEIAPREVGYRLCDDGRGLCRPWRDVSLAIYPGALHILTGSGAQAKVRALFSHRQPYASSTDTCGHDESWYVLSNAEPSWPLAAGSPNWSAANRLALGSVSGFQTLWIRARDYAGNETRARFPLCVRTLSTPESTLARPILRDCPADNGATPSDCRAGVSPALRAAGRSVRVCAVNAGADPVPKELRIRLRLRMIHAGLTAASWSQRFDWDGRWSPGEERCQDVTALSEEDWSVWHSYMRIFGNRLTLRADLEFEGATGSIEDDPLATPQGATTGLGELLSSRRP